MVAERVRELVERIEALDPEPGWLGPVPEATVKKVERALGVRLPPAFREFVKQVGGGGPVVTVSGIDPNEPLDEYTMGSLYGDTIAYREYDGFPRTLLVVVRDPEDHYTFCLGISGTATDATAEAPVVVYNTEDGSIEPHAADFLAFYEPFLRQQLGGGAS